MDLGVSTSIPGSSIASSRVLEIDDREVGPPASTGEPWLAALLVVADCAALTLSMLIGLWFLDQIRTRGVGVPRFTGELIFVPAFIVGLLVHGSYAHDTQRVLSSVAHTIIVVARSLATGVLLALALDAVLGPHHRRDLQLTQAVALALPALVLVPALRGAATSALRHGHRAGRVLVLGSGRIAAAVSARLSKYSDVTVVGMVDDDPISTDGVLGALADLRAVCRRQHVDRVVVAFSRSPVPKVLDALRSLDDGVAISFVPRFYELLSWRSHLEEMYGIPLIHVAPNDLSRSARALKRSFDVVVGTAALLALTPLWVVVTLAIKLDSPGPVVFRQLRTGYEGRPFRIFKLRTMYEGAEAQRAALEQANEVDGPIFKIRNDPRITRVGSWLRRTSIDELPQLLNVVLGEMSLVGPRPFPVSESAQIEGFAARRFVVRPGMTGLWQVSGRSDLSFDDLCHLDGIYVTSWSFWWDLRILWQTPVCVFGRRGAC